MVAKAGHLPNGKPWRLAKALIELEAEVNAKWPQRDKDSDGSIGDASHQARSSDHNPWIIDEDGNHIVSALDITHDPAHGFDSYAFAEWLRTQKDPRIKYVISNRRIMSGDGGVSPWVWRKYGGSNPHDHHNHISLREQKRYYDDVHNWGVAPITLPISPPAQQPKPAPRTLRLGDRNADVLLLQTKLNIKSTRVRADSSFGPMTKDSVIDFQKAHGLHADGIVGPQTWKELLS